MLICPQGKGKGMHVLRPGPGSTDLRARVRFGPSVKRTNNTLYNTFRAFSGCYIFQARKKSFHNCANLRLVEQKINN